MLLHVKETAPKYNGIDKKQQRWEWKKCRLFGTVEANVKESLIRRKEGRENNNRKNTWHFIFRLCMRACVRRIMPLI